MELGKEGVRASGSIPVRQELKAAYYGDLRGSLGEFLSSYSYLLCLGILKEITCLPQMVICPACGSEIEFLRFYKRVKEWQYGYIDKNGTHYTQRDSINSSVCEYKCPSCYAILFDNEADARKFFSLED